MELREYIELGAKKAGSLTELGKMLDMSQPTISGAKAHKRPMTDVQLKKLAMYINVPFDTLVAANNIAMGKNVEFWRPFVQHAKAASIALAVSLVTNFVTPSPAEAAQAVKSNSHDLYYVKRRMKATLKKRHLFWVLSPLFKRFMKAMQSRFKARIPQPQGV